MYVLNDLGDQGGRDEVAVVKEFVEEKGTRERRSLLLYPDQR
jgi:hypothetical protein